MRAAKGEGSIFKTANGYRGYVTVGGMRKYFSGKTKVEASAKRQELLQRKKKGTLTAGRSMTVEQWLTHYMTSIADLRPKTQTMDEWVIRKHLIPMFGQTPLDKLTLEQVEEWVASLGLKPSSVRRYVAPLRAAIEEAVRRGKVGHNVVHGLKLPKVGRRDTSAYSEEDRDAILAAATGWNRARWYIGLVFGIRPAEVLGLTWPMFDANAGTLTLRYQLLRITGRGLILQDATKTEAGERVIRLPRRMVAMLLEHRKEQMLCMAELGDEWKPWEFDGQPVPLMFTQANGRPISPELDTKRWKALLASAGLGDERRYKARHTGATHLLQASGGDVALVADILGHSDASFTMRTYVHPMEKRAAELAEKMDAPYGAPYEPDDPRSTAERDRTGSAESRG
ncbi:tyrosine-type recombinase/integrase [Agromyces sp. NPDC058064]|uniref:tyrosine-type recombinase/integrase n=1 Tax=Agromyces sp. NPDC058064 TaxID=3346322 RepID=UPI0036DD8FFC